VATALLARDVGVRATIDMLYREAVREVTEAQFHVDLAGNRYAHARRARERSSLARVAMPDVTQLG